MPFVEGSGTQDQDQMPRRGSIPFFGSGRSGSKQLAGQVRIAERESPVPGCLRSCSKVKEQLMLSQNGDHQREADNWPPRRYRNGSCCNCQQPPIAPLLGPPWTSASLSVIGYGCVDLHSRVQVVLLRYLCHPLGDKSFNGTALKWKRRPIQQGGCGLAGTVQS